MNTVTLNGVSALDPPKSSRQSGWFETHSGYLPGRGKFLFKQKDWGDIVGGTPGDPVLLEIKHHLTDGGVSMNVHPVGYTVYSSAIGSGTDLNIIEVLVYDRRYERLQATFGNNYNVQKEGFPYEVDSPFDPIFYPSTLTGGVEHPWTTVASDLVITQIGMPTAWKPRNLVLEGVTTGKAQQRVADFLSMVLGYDWNGNESLLDLGDVLKANNQTVLDLVKNLDVLLTTHKRNNGPDTFRFHFRIVDVGATDPYLNRYKLENQTTSLAGGIGTEPITVGNWVAVPDNGSFRENATFALIAVELKDNMIKRYYQDPEEHMYPGIWPFFCDGRIRGIRWESNAFGATTRVRMNDERWFSTEALSKEEADQVSYGAGVAELSPEKITLVQSSTVKDVIVGKITAVSGVSPFFLYDAEGIHDPNINVVGVAPANVRVTSLDILSSQVDDECFLYVNGTGVARLFLLEQIDHSECPPLGVSSRLGPDVFISFEVHRRALDQIMRDNFK